MKDLKTANSGLYDSLRKAYSAERAASFAYVGHAAALRDPAERQAIKKIEDDEWDHRREVGKIMERWDVPVSRWYEIKYWWVGKAIGLSCHLIGRFMPYFFAGKLESGNVCEYFVMLRQFRELGIYEHEDELYEMGVREKEHEVYFQGVIEGEPWLPFFEKVFNWGEGTSLNDVDYDDLRPASDADQYCSKYNQKRRARARSMPRGAGDPIETKRPPPFGLSSWSKASEGPTNGTMNAKQKVILAGGSGFLGRALAKQLSQAGYQVVVLTRRLGARADCGRVAYWDGVTKGVWCAELEGAHAVINLAGRSVDCRYTLKNRRLILESRLKSTRILALAIKDCATPPKLWVNAASATIYADTRGEAPANTESDGVIGEGFSVGVCQEWEAEFNRWTLPATKQVCLRVAITLGADGGAMVPLMNLARFGLGGRQGDGQQWVSWLHVDDFCGIVEAVIEGRVNGSLYNCAAPQQCKNVEFMSAIRKAVGGLARYVGLPTPKFLLKLGAFLIRTETELVLKSRKVAPGNLIQEGYEFKYPQIAGAVRAIVARSEGRALPDRRLAEASGASPERRCGHARAQPLR